MSKVKTPLICDQIKVIDSFIKCDVITVRVQKILKNYISFWEKKTDWRNKHNIGTYPKKKLLSLVKMAILEGKLLILSKCGRIITFSIRPIK